MSDIEKDTREAIERLIQMLTGIGMSREEAIQTLFDKAREENFSDEEIAAILYLTDNKGQMQ